MTTITVQFSSSSMYQTALPSILHWPVLLVRGFTADTAACQALIEHRRACGTLRERSDRHPDRRAEIIIRGIIEWLKDEKKRHVRFVMPSQMLDGD